LKKTPQEPEYYQILSYIIFIQETSVQEALNQADEEGETPIHRAAVIANIEV
jgi:hypothetical protein